LLTRVFPFYRDREGYSLYQSTKKIRRRLKLVTAVRWLDCYVNSLTVWNQSIPFELSNDRDVAAEFLTCGKSIILDDHPQLDIGIIFQVHKFKWASIRDAYSYISSYDNKTLLVSDSRKKYLVDTKKFPQIWKSVVKECDKNRQPTYHNEVCLGPDRKVIGIAFNEGPNNFFGRKQARKLGNWLNVPIEPVRRYKQ